MAPDNPSVENIADKEVWENFFLDFDKKSFLNSWNWGEFRESMGCKIWRKGIFSEGKIVALALITKIVSRRGSFLLLTHSPLSKNIKSSEAIIEETLAIGREEKVDFIRVFPIWNENTEEDILLTRLGFRPSPAKIFHKRSVELDINRGEEDLLSGMRKTTRYMVKKARNIRGLGLTISKNQNDLDKFYEIYKNTSFKQHFKPFSADYLKKELKFFSEEDRADIFLALYEGKPIAGAIIIYWQKTAFYHHGASILPNIPASYLIQWEVIKRAKERGCLKYDFWAIAPDDSPNHPWRGLTLFKKGFGGHEISYAETKDLPMTTKYWLTWFLEKIS